ncbi:hypothetical protein RA20_00085 [Leisingera sp. ANG-Vp]|nr:hypothetical protein RA20_00085 [Leisingera sp. ANG-Vp]
MLRMLGTSQSAILKTLLYRPEGANIDALSQSLEISRNATYQHVKTLERDGLITSHRVEKTKGRPGQTYRLTRKGQATFKQSYSLIATLLVSAVKDRLGTDETKALLQDLGRTLAAGLQEDLAGLSAEDKIREISAALASLGYEASLEDAEPGSLPVIAAHNCVFHDVAEEHPEVCEMDLTLLRGLSGCQVEHRECIVRGGQRCRFAFRKD